MENPKISQEHKIKSETFFNYIAKWVDLCNNIFPMKTMIICEWVLRSIEAQQFWLILLDRWVKLSFCWGRQSSFFRRFSPSLVSLFSWWLRWVVWCQLWSALSRRLPLFWWFIWWWARRGQGSLVLLIDRLFLLWRVLLIKFLLFLRGRRWFLFPPDIFDRVYRITTACEHRRRSFHHPPLPHFLNEIVVVSDSIWFRCSRLGFRYWCDTVWMFCALIEKAVAVGLGRLWSGDCYWLAVATAAVLKNCGVRLRRESVKGEEGQNLNYWLFGGRRRCTTVCHFWLPRNWSILSNSTPRSSWVAWWLCWRLPAMSPGLVPRGQA